MDQQAPDHSTLTVFRERLVIRGKLKVFEEMLEEIVQIALQRGIQFGSIQIVDSMHRIANVNTAKIKSGRERASGPGCALGVKHKRKVKNAAGQEESQVQ